MEFESVIGLEIHVQLSTESKIFCGCSTKFGSKPNSNTCPVCLGMPGSLPVLNEKVVEYAAKAAIATNCKIIKDNRFARKNYFYPDLPLGYQITQFELPICEDGYLDIKVNGDTKRIGFTRIHLENDAGKSNHDPDRPVSLVDLNRAGTPLIEMVSEPDLRSAEEAVIFLKQVRSIVRYLGICDGNMEQGSFRCDANISIMEKGSKEYGTRTEMKNLNSFRNIEKAINYEIKRQIRVKEDKGEITQETRLYDPNKNRTSAMRGKENDHDYRYFPDPDLLPVVLTDEWIEKIKSKIPELPEAKKERFIKDLNLSEDDAILLVSSRELADYFENALAVFNEPKPVCNWITGTLLGFLNSEGKTISESPVTPDNLANLVKLVSKDTISGKIAKTVFEEMTESGKSPEIIVEEKGLSQVSDVSELESIIDEILENNTAEVERFKGGNKKLMGFFVGQIMKKTKGSANPKVVNQIISEKLG
ncbi:MAG: Asp-tRNA(Asn)/Glu-tRNA(Gln) amidotransferase subunit GatB [Deltaproteobacteria bacterium]|nr:Asp-tRNA(Asn)/Glu-tRNA(Gln) amidotransferase subunit GatB [Deltaproteobacteria bacterium]